MESSNMILPLILGALFLLFLGLIGYACIVVSSDAERQEEYERKRRASHRCH